jgi:hypothetical protein
MGARPMQRLIQDTIRRALADELLFGRLVDGGRLTVGRRRQGRGAARHPAAAQERQAAHRGHAGLIAPKGRVSRPVGREPGPAEEARQHGVQRGVLGAHGSG